MIKAILLNGPPYCGKDTIGKLLQEKISCALTCFKFDLYKATADYFQVDLDWLIDKCTDRNFKDIKQFSMLGGRTPRGALIHVSEDITKPKHGNDYFGKLAAARITSNRDYLNLVVFTDSGFVDEVTPITEVAEVIIVQLHGRGSFEGDSRSYVNITGVDILQLQLVEDDPDITVRDIISILGLS